MYTVSQVWPKIKIDFSVGVWKNSETSQIVFFNGHIYFCCISSFLKTVDKAMKWSIYLQNEELYFNI